MDSFFALCKMCAWRWNLYRFLFTHTSRGFVLQFWSDDRHWRDRHKKIIWAWRGNCLPICAIMLLIILSMSIIVPAQ